MKFIHCFTKELKDKLLQSGYKLIADYNSFSIFENSSSQTFNFSQIDREQFIFSNKMII